MPYFNDLLTGKLNLEESIGKCMNFIMAGFWGGNSNLIHEICDMGAHLYINEFISKNRIDNEQALFGYILKKYSDKLLCIEPNSHINYINYYYFCNK
jgi:hypothetical protein